MSLFESGALGEELDPAGEGGLDEATLDLKGDEGARGGSGEGGGDEVEEEGIYQPDSSAERVCGKG